jgi:hypothetical protein
MYVRYKPIQGSYCPYTPWANDYGMDLTQPFKVSCVDKDSDVC